MRVACARRNESQASSPLPLGSSWATSRSRRPATSDFEGTCIRNQPISKVLAVASISKRFGRTTMTTELQADLDSLPAMDVVAVTVKVPYHLELATAALGAGNNTT